MPPTALHRAIVQPPQWLNTSRPLTAEDLAGRVILLDFWTFCCINCMHVIPDLKYLEEKFGGKLTVIGVHSAKFANEKESGNIRQAILRHGIEHPVVNDADFAVWRSFGVRAWPSFILIGPDGKIAQSYSGEGNRDSQEKDIAALLQKYGDTVVTAPLPIALEKDKEPDTALRFPGKLEIGVLDGHELLFVSDSGHHRILAMTLDGAVQHVIGSGKEGRKDGSFAEAEFRAPQGLAYQDGMLYVADTENHLLRRVDFRKGAVTTVAGTGEQGYERAAHNAPGLETPLASPWDVAFYPSPDSLTIAMAGTHQLWQFDLKTGRVTVAAGSGRESINDGALPFNSLSQPSGLSAHGRKLYFVDSETSSLRMLENGRVSTLIGTGLFDFGFADGRQGQARMQHALGVFADETGVYVADSYNHAIRRYDPATGQLSTVIGTGARGTLNEPNDLHAVKDRFYIADTNHHRIQVMDRQGEALSPLPVTITSTSEATAFAEQLPNTLALPPVMLAPGKQIPISLQLDPGWKVNDEAPSYLALFQLRQDGKERLLQQWNRSVLVSRQVMLPALEEGVEYRLQGTIYYCEDKAGSQCLVASVNLPLRVQPGGAQSLKLPIRQP